MDDWKITRDRKACERAGCPLPSAQQYYAVLEFPDCTRRDLCDACFCDLERRAEAPPVFWRAVRKASGHKELVLDLASLRLLFDKLGTVDGDRARALRYFCALLLLRKRVLKMVPARTEAQARADLVLVDPKFKEMEPIALVAPAIDLDDLAGMKDELLAALGEGDGEPAGDGADGGPGQAAATPLDATSS